LVQIAKELQASSIEHRASSTRSLLSQRVADCKSHFSAAPLSGDWPDSLTFAAANLRPVATAQRERKDDLPQMPPMSADGEIQFRIASEYICGANW
jgi:hypothetical protein